jgi:hypothetical protein
MLLMAVSNTLGASNKEKPSEANSPRAVPNEILVKFHRGASEEAVAEAHARIGTSELRRFSSVRGLALVRLPAGKSMTEALAAYRALPAVQYATPNYVRKLANNPNDPYFVNGYLWGLQNPAQPGVDIHAPDAWDLTTGSPDVVVMVIDTGIDYTHEDLAPNMWRNTADCFSDGIDHDNNGYVNDCYGINPAYGNSDPMDDTGPSGSHGTFIAGIIGAVGNNGIGVVGVNWQVGLMARKAFDSNANGSDSAIIACLDYALMMKQRGANIVATNNSWGGADYDPALYDAITEQMNAGILFIAAATNGLDEDITPSYPANYDLPNVIAVTSLDPNDQLTSGSAFGAHTVHLGAPGGSIWSTVVGSGYNIEGGTSYATAYVTGVAALLKANNPDWDWRAIKNLILAGGDDDPALRNYLYDTITAKRLNAYGAMTCTNSPLQRRFRPVGSGGGNIPFGSTINLSVLNINCAAPAGPVWVFVQPENVVIPLVDDGNGPDLAANDGLYSAVWTPPHTGNYTLTFPGNDVWSVNVMPAYTYSVVPFSWETITGENLNLSDDSVKSFGTPFSITLGEYSLPVLYVDSNGRVGPGAIIESSFTNTPLPNTQAPSYIVAPFWDDLLTIPNTDQNVFWGVTGTAPNKLVVEWRRVSRASGCQDPTATITFQVVFSEGSSDIVVNYANSAFGGPPACAEGDHGAAATVGLQLLPPSAAQFSFDQPSIQDQMSIRFTLVQPPS